jgi:hypothetical protein
MSIVSHLHHLFNPETCQACIHTLRWKDRPLQCPPWSTVSTFSLEAVLFCERTQLLEMACYVGDSVAAGIIGVFSGIALVRSFGINT